jgi:hypothetical protein
MIAKKKSFKDEIVEEFKRHTSILIEHVDSKVELVAEQYGSIIRKLEEHDERFNRADQRFDMVESNILLNRKAIDTAVARLDGIDGRLDNIDFGLRDHNQRITALE